MNTRPELTTRPTQYHAKCIVPADWGKKLSYIAADLGLPKHELLREAVLLLLRYHGHAEGLPEPTPPASEVTP